VNVLCITLLSALRHYYHVVCCASYCTECLQNRLTYLYFSVYDTFFIVFASSNVSSGMSFLFYRKQKYKSNRIHTSKVINHNLGVVPKGMVSYNFEDIMFCIRRNRT